MSLFTGRLIDILNTKHETNCNKYSFLCLVCPGTGKSFGKGRKMAIKTNSKQNKIINSNSVHLTGCHIDNATIMTYLTDFGDKINDEAEFEFTDQNIIEPINGLRLNQTYDIQPYKLPSAININLYPYNLLSMNDEAEYQTIDDFKHDSLNPYKYHNIHNLLSTNEHKHKQKTYVKTIIEPYASKQSICYSQITVSMAIGNIKNWFKEEAFHHIFYFSGHGSDKQYGGICFADGVLGYRQLANLWYSYGPNYCTFIVDACHAGWIVDAFKRINCSKKGGKVVIYYSCQKSEVSADEGTDGGAFTNQLFRNKKNCNKRFLEWGDSDYKPAQMIHKYKSGIKSQTPGLWISE